MHNIGSEIAKHTLQKCQVWVQLSIIVECNNTLGINYEKSACNVILRCR